MPTRCRSDAARCFCAVVLRRFLARRRDARHHFDGDAGLPAGSNHMIGVAGDVRAVEPHHAAPGLREALALVDDAGPEDTIVITGSLYLVGEARAMIGTKR